MATTTPVTAVPLTQAIGDVESASQALANAQSAQQTAKSAVDAAQQKLDTANAGLSTANSSADFAVNAFNATLDELIASATAAKIPVVTPSTSS